MQGRAWLCDARWLAGAEKSAALGELSGGRGLPQWAGDSPQLPPDSPQSDRLAGLPLEVQTLLPLAEPARKKNRKLPVDQLKDIVLKALCGSLAGTSELVALVDRDAEKL